MEVTSVSEHYDAIDRVEAGEEKWDEMYDAGQRRPYYVNKATGESSWSKVKENESQ